MKLIERFGDTVNNDNEELLILPHGEFQIDISQYIYEMIVLSVPLRRIHPGIKDGSLNTEALKKLKELTIKELKKEDKKEDKKNKEQALKNQAPIPNISMMISPPLPPTIGGDKKISFSIKPW